MRSLVAVLLLSVASLAHAVSSDSPEGRRIEYLITSIETLKDAEFVRNDTAYGAKAAAEHLRSKLESAGARVATAEDFIRLCASFSSMSGKPYQIRFTDGHVITAAEFLRARLIDLAH